MSFPNTYTTVVPNVTPIRSIDINNLEAKVGINGDTPGTNPLGISSLDYLINAKLDTTLFNVDHDGSGHHKEGDWHINAVAVTATAAELNKLDGAGATVTAANLNTLTNGGDATLLHIHGINQKILLEDQKPAGTNGGTFTQGDWRTRDLNTIVYDDTTVVTLVGNQFVLPAGTYEVFARALGIEVKLNKLRLRNMTDNLTTLTGTSSQASGGGSDDSTSFIIGRFTIAAPKTFQLQHRCSNTKNTVGFGEATNFGETEIYAQIQLTKIA